MILVTVYDDHYQSSDYFGKPIPELIEYFTTQKDKGKLLDVGCEQGRNLSIEVLLVDQFEFKGYDLTL